jgi:uncharacterized SAM-binding protein YcdF (DUF218 family)
MARSLSAAIGSGFPIHYSRRKPAPRWTLTNVISTLIERRPRRGSLGWAAEALAASRRSRTITLPEAKTNQQIGRLRRVSTSTSFRRAKGVRGLMLFQVSQILQLAIYPLHIAIVLLAVSLWLLWRAKYRSARWTVALAFIVLTVPSIPALVDPAIRTWEAAEPNIPIADQPNADAIVVLGGTVERTAPPRLWPEETIGSRLYCGYRLYRAGKSKLVVVCGGLEYPASDGTFRCEADDLSELLIDMGVPSSALALERNSHNTYENAVESAKILRERNLHSILLVTSALHMRRAAALFRKQGLDVHPAPNSHISTDGPMTWRAFVPNWWTFWRSGMFTKEVVGYVVYRAMGKL